MQFSDLATSPYFSDSGNTFEREGSKRFYVKTGYVVYLTYQSDMYVDYLEMDEESEKVTVGNNGESDYIENPFTITVSRVEEIAIL